MANHRRNYYRIMRKKHINRKKKIIKMYSHEGERWSYKYDGELSKGRVHCSCPICRKNNQNKHIKTRQELKLDFILKEFLQKNVDCF